MPVIELNGADFHELAQELIEKGHRLRFRATGESMLPFIQSADILEVEPVKGKKVWQGDILLVHVSNNRLLVHRVIKKAINENIKYLLKGDACQMPDGWFQQSEILGRITSLERGDIRKDLILPGERFKAWIIANAFLLAGKLTWLPGWIKKPFWYLVNR